MAPSPLLTNVTLALAALSSLLLQVALHDRQAAILPGWLQLVAAAVIAGAGARWAPRKTWAYGLSLGGLVLMPLVGDWAGRELLNHGDPSEVQLAYTLRNLMLGLAALRSRSRDLHFAGLASFFLVLFSFLWTMNLATTLLLVAYALLGMWWLLGCYWDGIQGRFADKSERAIPMRPALTAVAIVLLVVIVALPFARSSRATTALHGFFPSSGGTGRSDDFALGGVGDGNQMVAAKDNASSFGAVESELFLESRMPSLYDVFNEMGEASKRKKQGRQRAIPLASTAMKQNHRRLGQNQQANREFDTIRTGPTKPRDATSDYRSAALLQVRGRVPLHLGLEAYDTWDGRSLRSTGAAGPVLRKLDRDGADGRAWLRLSHVFPAPLFDHTERHQVRVINLKTKRVPAPPNLTAVNLDHLHDAGMFRCEPDGSLAIDAAAIPQLTVLNTESRRLPRLAAPPLTKSPPAADTGRLRQLAEAWTAGVASGWPQVAAIRDRLRVGYRLDPAAVVPEDCDDPVGHFLFESKQGPDYLFATAGALLVRSLGCDTRVRSGLYARPDNYDPIANLTSVYQEDAHFWFEVRSTTGMTFYEGGGADSGSWITVEPSPGYRVLHTPETLLARCIGAAVGLKRAAVAHPVLVAGGASLLAALVWLRVPLLDRLVTAWWSVAWRFGGPRRQVVETVRLLERRAWLRRRRRPPGTTIGRWPLDPSHASDESASAIADFRRFASWALYGEGATADGPADRIRSSCREAARLAMRNPHRPDQTRQAR